MDFDGRPVQSSLESVVRGTQRFGNSAPASTGMGIIVLIANCLNGLSMILIMCRDPMCCEVSEKFGGKFTFSDTSRNLSSLSANKKRVKMLRRRSSTGSADVVEWGAPQ